MTAGTTDLQQLQQWIGRSEQSSDQILLQRAQFMQATLDQAVSLQHGDPLPLAWHWLYFLQASPESQLGRDGHPLRGGFLPPVGLPRRMWAGSRLEFHQPLLIGDEIARRSEIKDITIKSGSSGVLCFVTVKHQYLRGDTLLLDEEHDIVYREDPTPGTALPAPPAIEREPEVSRSITPSAVLLFRYSALTFNGHRIHYDIDYCRQVENYPGLVFHGPLSATLLLDLLCRQVPAQQITRFSFRAVSPLFADQPFTLNLKQDTSHVDLWSANPDGRLATSARAELRI